MTEHLTDVDQLPAKERDNGLCYEHEYPRGGMSTTVWKKSSCPFCEIERLRTALTGVSTCSTCEACRGAALRALGGETACVHPFTKLGIDGDGVMWCTECQTKPLVIPTPWRDAETTGEGQ